jgi:hypothetical protein
MKHFAPANGDLLQWFITRLLFLIDAMSALVIAGAVFRLF